MEHERVSQAEGQLKEDMGIGEGMAGRSLGLNRAERQRSGRSESWGRERKGIGKDQSGQSGWAMQVTVHHCTSSEGVRCPLRTLQICTFMMMILQQVTGKHLEEGIPFSGLWKGAVWATGSLDDFEGSVMSHMSRALDCVVKALGQL